MRLQVYLAYSKPDTEYDQFETASDRITCYQVKKLVGAQPSAHTYILLPPHDYRKGCQCFSCTLTRQNPRVWTSPTTWKENPATWHRWVRYCGPASTRLTLEGGERFLVVEDSDMPEFARQLGTWGRYGDLLALDYYLAKYHVPKPKREPKVKPKPEDYSWIEGQPAAA